MTVVLFNFIFGKHLLFPHQIRLDHHNSMCEMLIYAELSSLVDNIK